MTPEGKVKADVRKFLKTLGPQVRAFWPVQMGMGAPALDLILCIRGRYLEIEFKAPGNKPTKMQKLIERDVTLAGGVSHWFADAEMFKGFILELFPGVGQ